MNAAGREFFDACVRGVRKKRSARIEKLSYTIQIEVGGMSAHRGDQVRMRSNRCDISPAIGRHIHLHIIHGVGDDAESFRVGDDKSETAVEVLQLAMRGGRCTAY